MKQRTEKSGDADPDGRANRAHQRNGHRSSKRERDQQHAAVGVDPAPEQEVPGHVDERAETERQTGGRDREVVRLDQQRAHVHERACPAREREELSDRPARDTRVRQHGSQADARRCGWSRRAPEKEHGGDHGQRDRDDGPRESPADLSDHSDERHPDDPGERRPEQREREDARAFSGRRPLRHRRDGGRVRDSDPHSGERLSDDEHCECRSCGAQERAAGEDRDAGEKELPQAERVSQQAGRERRDAGRQSRDGSQLAGRRDRDVEVTRNVRQQGVEHHERCLRRRERRQAA